MQPGSSSTFTRLSPSISTMSNFSEKVEILKSRDVPTTAVVLEDAVGNGSRLDITSFIRDSISGQFGSRLTPNTNSMRWEKISVGWDPDALESWIKGWGVIATLKKIKREFSNLGATLLQ